MLNISRNVAIPDEEIELQAIRAQGAGGQNVNKVASAIHLRFDIHASSLPDAYKQRLLQLKDQRITRQGVIVIKAQQHRSQDKNRQAALDRLQALVRSAILPAKKRIQTSVPAGAKRKRLEQKAQRGKLKNLRSKIHTLD